jgi:phosphoribosyl-AMP cyclohydrolase
MIAGLPGRSPDFSRGLLTAVVQDAATAQVLMVAHMNQEAYEATLSSGRATFYSRSRQRLWEKGETSGNTLRVLEIRLDCDGDAVLLRVEPAGPACHTGARSCFDQSELSQATGEPSDPR